MARIHFFEFEDLKWFPSFLRNYLTDYLQYLSNQVKLFKPILPILQKGINSCGNNQIIDLASGGGGGFLWLNEELKKTNPELKILLTDYYPNIDAFEYTKKKSNNFDYIQTSIDARDVPKELKGLRTQFLSLHHFKPKDVMKILQNAVDSNNAIAVFEAQERSFLSVMYMLFSPLSVLFTTPFIRPFKIGRILFTYIIPIVPIFVMWDGVISSLRTYSVKEMKDLVNKLNDKGKFNWEIGKVKSGTGVNLYLLGTRKKPSD